MCNTSVDARGMSCPEPVLMTMQTISSGVDTFEVLVDNHVAVENITRCCNNKGYAVVVTEDGETYRLNISRK